MKCDFIFTFLFCYQLQTMTIRPWGKRTQIISLLFNNYDQYKKHITMEKLKLRVVSLVFLIVAGLMSISLQLSAQASVSTVNKGANLKAKDWKPDAGFESLFDGTTLSGWCYRSKEGEVTEKFDGKRVSSDGRYSAGNGILTVNYPVGAERKVQESWTLREFPKNFVLKIEFRASKNADSGFFCAVSSFNAVIISWPAPIQI
jgi:hypothetical protein